MLRYNERHNHNVAPHVGAWIETNIRLTVKRSEVVAPHVGAWIETPEQLKQVVDAMESLPTWERGLKPILCQVADDILSRSPRGSVD